MWKPVDYSQFLFENVLLQKYWKLGDGVSILFYIMMGLLTCCYVWSRRQSFYVCMYVCMYVYIVCMYRALSLSDLCSSGFLVDVNHHCKSG
jgi:hypothetical protein